MSITDRLDEIQARADAATDGPWHEGPGMTFVRARVIYDMVTNDAQLTTSHVLADVTRNHDAEFIASARTDVPRLVAALRAVLDLHQPMTMYEHEDCCENDSDDHREERHAEDVVHGGEFFCMDLPTGIVLCAECSRDLDFDGRDYPCPTVRAVEAALGEVDQ